MAYCFVLQPVALYNFIEFESTFPVLLWGYVADCWELRGMVSIYFIGKDEYNWFLHKYKGLFLDCLIFLLHLLQSVCCSKYSAKTTNVSILNPSLYLLHLFVLKYFRIFVAVPNAIYYASLSSKVSHDENFEENLINFVAFFLHGLVC